MAGIHCGHRQAWRHGIVLVSPLLATLGVAKLTVSLAVAVASLLTSKTLDFARF